MLKNYFKIAWRNLLRHRSFAFINIVGLAVGLACCLTIYLFVQDELRYDRFHAKADRIYRLVNTRILEGSQNQLAVTPPAYGPTLKAVFPEVENMVRLFSLGNKQLVAYEDKKFFESDFLLADSTFFDVFSFPLVRGNPTEVLKGPGTMVITESVARKYFGRQDPVNKTITFLGEIKFRVTGVMKDLPKHSHLKIGAVGAFSTLRAFTGPERLKNWRWQQFYTYIQLPEGYDPARLEAKLPAFLTRYAQPEISKLNMQYQSRLQPLTEVHLRSAELEYDIVQKGNINHVYAFSVIALFALLIACFNFMNLSTARSMLRAREVGLRKVIGANRWQLVRQFMGESLLLTALAMVLALGLTYFSLTVFNDWSGKILSLDEVVSPAFVAGIVGTVLLVGALAGVYPAFFLSAFQPVIVLKAQSGSGKGGGYSLRKTLVVLQFTVSTVLISGTGVVFTQLRYIQEKDLGFSREQAIVLPLRNETMTRGYENLKTELLRNPAVTAATACYGIPGGLFAGDGIRLPGREQEISTNMFLIDPDYIPTLGMRMVAGRNFSRNYGTDAGEGFIINETAVKTFGFETPQKALGKEILWDKWQRGKAPNDTVKRGRVVGVVRDFHYKSLHQKVEPAVLHIVPEAFSSVVVRVRPDQLTATLDFLKAKWQSQAPDWPFEYQIVDEQFAGLYRSEQIFGRLFSLFTSLSIFIACLGLFGLATFMAQQRTKEIGVRKVLGASVTSIVALLSKDFLKLVLIAIAVSVPLAWYAMNRWLQDFAYRIDMPWWVFALAGVVAVLIAFVTVFYQSVKAALMNPVVSLRSE